jgi:hypothetical protein
MFMLAFTAMFTLALTGAASAQEKPKIVMTPPPQIDVNDGSAMFREWSGVVSWCTCRTCRC